MDKISFITQINPVLQRLNFRKKGKYWYKNVDNHICCINVQGSQWSKDDYYVQIGFAFPVLDIQNPTILQWNCRHRCIGSSGEKNIHPQDLFWAIDNIFNKIKHTSEIPAFLKNIKAVKVASQLWF